MPYGQQYNPMQEPPMTPQQYQAWYVQQPNMQNQLATPQQYQMWYMQQQQQPAMPMQQPMQQQPMHYRNPNMSMNNPPMPPAGGFGTPSNNNPMQMNNSSSGTNRSRRSRSTTFVEPTHKVQNRTSNNNTPVNVGKTNTLLEPGMEEIVAYTEDNKTINIYRGRTTMAKGSDELKIETPTEEYDVPVPDANIIGDYAYARLLISLYSGECGVAYAKCETGYHFPKERDIALGEDRCATKGIKTATAIKYINTRLTAYLNTALMLLKDNINIDDIIEDYAAVINIVRDEYSAGLSEYIEDTIGGIINNIKSVDNEEDPSEVIVVPEIYMAFKTTDAMNEALEADEVMLTNESAPNIMESINFINETYPKHILYLLTDKCKYYVFASENGATAALRKVTK